jgi:arylsulfatase A-like enzyme
LIFLTADHAAARAPSHLHSLRIPAGTVRGRVMADSLENFLGRRFGPGKWVERYINQQVYLNLAHIAKQQVRLNDIQDAAAAFLLGQPAVNRTIAAHTLTSSYWGAGLMGMVSNGYHPRRSGDVLVMLEPEWFEGSGRHPHLGTTHGSYYTYDTHVPILWYGWRVRPGESVQRVSITDIASTLAAWLNISQPNGNTGHPLQEFMRF